MKKWIKPAAAALCAVLLAAPTATYAAPAPAPAPARDEYRQDFYEAVNKEWLAAAKIPAGQSAWSGFQENDKRTNDYLASLLRSYNKRYATLKRGSDEKQLADFYNALLDTNERDRQGLAPIRGQLAAVAAVQSIESLNRLLVKKAANGSQAALTYMVGPDLKNSAMNILYVDGPSPRLERAYYFDESADAKAVRTAYISYMKRLLQLKGDAPSLASQKANAAFLLEKKMAKAAMKPEEARDLHAIYRVTSLAQLASRAPRVDVRGILKAAGVSGARKIISSEPAKMRMLNDSFTKGNLTAWKAFLEVGILSSGANSLTSSIEKAAADYEAAFTGTAVRLPKEERAFQATNFMLGQLLGQAYVKKFFSPAAKADVTALVRSIIKDYEARIARLDWMSEATKKRAVEKLNAITIKVGYPDKQEDAGKIGVRSFAEGGSAYDNLLRVARFNWRKNVDQLNKPVDKTEWLMTPQTINAYYSPTANEIVFPAAILQAPLYDLQAPREKNLGGIGVVIAHEISHAFDDQGAQFDAGGNMRSWWSPQDKAEFDKRAKKLAALYSGFEVFPGRFINGTTNLGEALADLGGVNVMVDIAEREQLDLRALFRYYAEGWRMKMTREAALAQLAMDVHPPSKYRVNGTLVNIDAFHESFGVQPGDGMYKKPEDRVKVW